MTEKNSQENLSFIELHSRNRYWFIVLPILLLITASIYLLFTPNKYKVTTTIVLPGRGLTTDDIKSKVLVQKTLDQLPFQVSYYHKGFFKRTEVYGDSLPIKLTFTKQVSVDTVEEVTAKILDDQLFEIKQNDTITSFFFNKLVAYPFAQFKGLKGPAFSKNAAPIIIKFNDPDKVLAQYYNNLKVKSIGDDNKTAEISIIATTPEKGADFLNSLISVLNQSDLAIAQPKVSATPSAQLIGSEKIRNRIAELKIKAEKFKNELIKAQSVVKPTIHYTTTHKKISYMQEKILDAVQPYVKSLVSQFVQIPDSYQVDDKELERLIINFNETELDKQRTLQDSQINQNKITGLNKQIASLKVSILQKIDNNKKGGAVVTSSSSPKNSSSVTYHNIQDSITKINSELMAYNTLLLKSKAISPVRAAITPNITVIEKPSDNTSTYPSTALIYLFALLAGLVLPFSFPYLKYLNFTVNHKIDIKKISTRIDELTRVKEID